MLVIFTLIVKYCTFYAQNYLAVTIHVVYPDFSIKTYTAIVGICYTSRRFCLILQAGFVCFL